VSAPSDTDLLPLIEAMARGDRAALEPFIGLVGPWIHGLQLHITGTTVAAAVLVEETLARVWSDAPLYDHHFGAPMAWVMAVARAEGMSYVEKRRGREARLKSRPDAHTVLDPDADGADPRVVAAFERLGEGQADLLRKAFLEGAPGGTKGAQDRESLAEALPALAEALKGA